MGDRFSPWIIPEGFGIVNDLEAPSTGLEKRWGRSNPKTPTRRIKSTILNAFIAKLAYRLLNIFL